MNILLLTLALALLIPQQPPTAAKKDPEPIPVEVNYDRFKDLTVLTIPPQIVFEQPSTSRLVFAVHVTHPGKVKPESYYPTINLIFVAASKNVAFVSPQPVLYVLADGERGNLGVATLTDSKTTDSYTAKTFILTITPTTARTIFKADKVEMQFGGVEFVVNDELRGAIRDLLGHL